MDWKRAIGEERAALARIVALLLALADLADLACCRGASFGCLLLSILRPAEAAMRQFLDDEPDTSPAAKGRSGYTCEELACLAARLRAFAAGLLGEAGMSVLWQAMQPFSTQPCRVLAPTTRRQRVRPLWTGSCRHVVAPLRDCRQL